MQEGGNKAKAGQAVRLLDLAVARTFGAWDNLHGLPSGTAFSDAIKRAAATHHGHAGRAFLEKLTRDDRDFCSLLERIKGLQEFSVKGSEGQEKRAAARFALIALAGEIAIEIIHGTGSYKSPLLCETLLGVMNSSTRHRMSFADFENVMESK
jgi:putative DNA primase/helicase